MEIFKKIFRSLLSNFAPLPHNNPQKLLSYGTSSKHHTVFVVSKKCGRSDELLCEYFPEFTHSPH